MEMSEEPKPSKAEQILVFDPKQELYFKGPYDKMVTSYLKITNPSDRRVCYKVKVTAPKCYSVRPNVGFIDAKGEANIAVKFQPFDVEQSDWKKHKFQVQSVFASEGEANEETPWKEILTENIMESKLKCVFDVPADETESSNGESGTANYESPHSTTSAVTSKSPHSSPYGIEDYREDGSGSSQRLNSVVNDKNGYKEENRILKDEVAHLQEEIMHLNEKGLKQRMMCASSTAVATTLADVLAQQCVGNDFGKQENELSQLFLNPKVLTFSMVLFIFGIVFGKVYFN